MRSIISLERNNFLSDSAEPLLEMWSHLTSPEMHGLLKLTMEIDRRAIQGESETQRFIE